MRELNQILDKEKSSEEELKEAKAKAQKELEQKEAELKTQLERGRILDEEFIKKLEQEKTKKEQEIAEAIQQQTQDRIYELNQKEQKNFDEAVNYLMRALCG